MSIYVHRYGSGARALVAFHGWSGDHRTFAPLAAGVPEGASIYAIDHPGFGSSPAPERWSFEHIVDGIRAEIDRLGIDRLTLVGNCSGVFTALHLAMRIDPARVERVVLIDPFAYVPWYFRLLSGRLGRLFYSISFANPIGRWLTNLALRSKRTEQSDLTESFAELDHDAAFECLRLLCSQENIRPFESLRTEVDIIHGERTFSAVRRSLVMWQQLWPWARVHTIPGAGHLPIREASADVAALVFGNRGDK